MASFGLLTYSTRNLGDDIQSLAAAQYLPHIDHYINRDRLSEVAYKHDIHMICNGWFLEYPFDWPPPPNIHPLFISFHIADKQHVSSVLTHPVLTQYYKQYEPIGCRDTHTVKLLHSIGVQAYFSHCLTLTLQRPPVQRSNQILFLDPFGTERDYAFPDPSSPAFRHDLWGLFPKEVRARSLYLTHYSTERDPRQRFKRARELLDKYASASLVITSRLHCALPCLAFGTPVIFLYRNGESYRIRNALPLLRTYSFDELQEGKAQIDWGRPLQNPVDISVIAKELSQRCVHFVRDAEPIFTPAQ